MNKKMGVSHIMPCSVNLLTVSICRIVCSAPVYPGTKFRSRIAAIKA
jgi:hypothetical protein